MSRITYQPGMDPWKPSKPRRAMETWGDPNPCKNDQHGGSPDKADHPRSRGGCPVNPDPTTPLRLAASYGGTRRCTNPGHKKFTCRMADDPSKHFGPTCTLSAVKLYSAAELAEAANRGRPKAWKAPSLKPEGRPFAPAPGEVGSHVSWTREDGTVGWGQVWGIAFPERGKRCVHVVTEGQGAETVQSDQIIAAYADLRTA